MKKNPAKIKQIKQAVFFAVICLISVFFLRDTFVEIIPGTIPEDTRVKVGLMTTIDGIGGEPAGILLKMLRGEAFADKIRVDYIEPASAADYLSDLGAFSRSGYELIFCAGSDLTGAVRAQALRNPDIFYVITDYIPEQEPLPENITGIAYDIYGAAYLAGAAAANITRTNKIGVIIGENNPVGTAYAAAFYSGALSEKDDIIISGVYIDTMSDADLAQSVANQIYANRADVIFTSAGKADTGVLAAAQSARLYAAAADSVLSSADELNILISAVKKYEIIEELLRDYLAGSLKGGEIFTLGLKDDGIEIKLSNAISADPDNLSRHENAKNKIINGAVKIPYNKSELLEKFPGIDFMN